jgi:hypothetical protein
MDAEAKRAEARPPEHAAAGRALRAAARALEVLGFVILGLGALSARVIAAGEEEIAASTAALIAGDPREATVRARRAAGWYAPGAPHVRVAYERLVALAVAAEKIGDVEASLFAWRAVRTAATETRWLTTPHAEDLAQANEAVARLSAGLPRPHGSRTDSAAAIEQRHLESLARDEAPRAPWVAVLVGSLAIWAGGLWALGRSMRRAGRFAWRASGAAVIAVAVGAALWLLALWRA